MIKVYYKGYGKKQSLDTGEIANEIAYTHGECYLTSMDVEAFKTIGCTEIFCTTNKEKTFAFRLTDSLGKPCIFKIKKDKKQYEKDNISGLSNTLELISDNDIPFITNPEPPINPVENNAPPDNHSLISSKKPPKISINQKRDNNFVEWRDEANPDFDNLTKNQIRYYLVTKNKDLWEKGFSNWWDKQQFFKLKRGRKNVHRKTSTL